ncbi:hypothetical protein BH09VER1_BH09VER1_50470 [soil metagenome]
MPSLQLKARKRREKPVVVAQPQSAKPRRFPWSTVGLALAPLGFISLLLVVLFSCGKPPESTLLKRVVHAPLVGKPVNPLEPETETHLTLGQLEAKQSLADNEFRLKNYAEAERDYREIGPDSMRKDPIIFRVFICMVLQGNPEEARRFLASFGGSPSSASGANPPRHHVDTRGDCPIGGLAGVLGDGGAGACSGGDLSIRERSAEGRVLDFWVGPRLSPGAVHATLPVGESPFAALT